MFIAGLVALGAFTAAFDAGSASERMFDLVSATIAVGVLCVAALIHRAKTGTDELASFLRGPGKVIVIYAIVIPAVAYWLLARALHLGEAGKEMLAPLVGLGGLGLAMWRWEQGK